MNLDVEFPERTRLKYMDKVPLMHGNIRPPKMTKSLKFMRGPETVQNFLVYQQFGIVVSIITFSEIFRMVYYYLSCYSFMGKCSVLCVHFSTSWLTA